MSQERLVLLAIYKKNLDTIKENIPAKMELNESLFKITLIYSSFEVFEYFLSIGYDINKTSYNSLFVSCGNMLHDERIADYILFNNLVPLNKKLLEDCLYNASLQQNIKIMKSLLLKGAPVPVEIGINAVKLQNGDMLKLLIDYGLNIDTPNPSNSPSFSCRQMSVYYGIDINKLLV